ncbi:hypothetical protein [Coleofasciculus sp. FACHB-SPT9]|uniref:hypothetical protein n=1 Tax=Cyanophyceae TaxID=3028117 RepID=UPI0016860B2F|nr:hypothetical protein [Coleofasciculus sp. FACHB-SPT9]MBD1890621.1 hypothetical protein [Coleofasciculus sp. FACHB-SPT9]
MEKSQVGWLQPGKSCLPLWMQPFLNVSEDAQIGHGDMEAWKESNKKLHFSIITS